MSKQIKLGFDKNTSRPVTTDQILVDVRGNLLRDSADDFLYTETTETPRSFFAARNATSVYVNNEPTPDVRSGGSIAVIEQFAETSEVSNSLLGIPRAERQQTLLSDVSIYGTSDTWEFYRNPQTGQPTEWSTRRNRTYGRRFSPRLAEHPEEQALALEVFPAPWTFPYGPRWADQGRFNSILFTQYRRFIELGNALYEFYANQNLEVFASNHFLIPGMALVDETTDVIYNDDIDLAFEYVEQWTITWMNIRDNRLDDPLVAGRKLSAGALNIIMRTELGLPFTFDQTQPGYSSTPYRYCQLQSRESFRYQPGAISGFTFGIKLNADPATLTNVLEWGCANETDQLMFQVRGSQFNIVRRSTVPLSRRNLELNGFTLSDQKQISSPNPFERSNEASTTSDIGLPPENRSQLYELLIQSDRFNGDPLDGSGPSGYTISFNEVTMYKIEYSWYGAIGAKFYAYIPVGNAETRWVLIHTLIIENTLENPSLQNPFMHFRYSIYLSDTSSLREPMYLYKYGASYYIDGTDEGSFNYKSYKIPTEKSITSLNSTPLIGFTPKDKILNRDGIGTFNQKNFYIEKISAASDKDIRLDILECTGCPGGHGYFYATSLQNGQKGLVDQFRITTAGDLVFVDPEKDFEPFVGNKKIIAPGVFSAYVFSKEGDTQSLTINRRLGSQRINTPIDSVTFSQNDQARVGNTQVNLRGYEFTGRLTGFDDIIASIVPIVKSNIKVLFLNPIATESNGQWAEFRIGITPKKPELVVQENQNNASQINDNIELLGEQEGISILSESELQFLVGSSIEENNETSEVLLFDGQPLNMDNEIFGEFAQYQSSKNIQGIETRESDTRHGNTMQQDPRIGRPRGAFSGDCSELNFTISDLVLSNVNYASTDPSGQLEGNHFIVFTTEPPVTETTGGGIGIFDGNRYIDSEITFTSSIVPFFNQQTGINNFVARISDDISQSSNISATGIALRSVRCFGRFINRTKILPFSTIEYYLFIAMRDNARINNIVVQEFDDISSFTHTPVWIKDDTSNISIIQIGNADPPANVIDKLSTSNEYIGTDGRFYMGGVTFTGNVPSNFSEKSRLDSIKSDDQLSLPLRPSSLKTSIYLSAGKNNTVNMSHIFGTDRFKLTKGSFNNKYLQISSIITEPGEIGSVQINVSGKEQ